MSTIAHSYLVYQVYDNVPIGSIQFYAHLLHIYVVYIRTAVMIFITPEYLFGMYATDVHLVAGMIKVCPRLGELRNQLIGGTL